MKKLLAFFMIIVMCLSLYACGDKADTQTPTTDAAQTQETAQPESTESETTQAEGTESETTQAETTVESTTAKPVETPATTVHTHSWKKATCKAPKTCKTCGATEGSMAEHNWKNATCTSPKKCSECGTTEGSALGHSWSDATCTSPKKCSVCGTTDGSAGSHNIKNGVCTDCGNNAKAAEYAYLAGADFRRVRRDYSQAVANGGYVVVFTASNGDTCVLTYVSYKIISNYSVTTLHNITTGETIEDPSDYYEKLADRAYGASRSYYLSLSNTILGKEIVAMKGLSSVLKTGTHSGEGAYVSAAELNL